MDKEIIYRYLKCETTPEEEDRILDWVEASPAHRRQLNAMQLTLNALSVQRMSKDKLLLDSKARRWSPATIARRVIAVAAAFILAVGIGFGLAVIVLDRGAGQNVTVEVPAGQRMSITLMDGTKVMLNSEARLEYPTVFSKKQRRVKITGEAMFEVEHNTNVPFIVETFVCETKVLGTKFNIEADKKKNIFSVALLEGSVEVSDNTHTEVFIMKPDETVKLVNGKLQLEHALNADKLLWTDGILSIKNMTFEEVVEKLEQYYGVTIRIEREECLEIESQWTKIRISDGIDHALRMLQYNADFIYERDSMHNMIIIK